eukprot:3588189-Prymnesium_polylepis.3
MAHLTPADLDSGLPIAAQKARLAATRNLNGPRAGRRPPVERSSHCRTRSPKRRTTSRSWRYCIRRSPG